jgi:hypothetical protein
MIKVLAAMAAALTLAACATLVAPSTIQVVEVVPRAVRGMVTGTAVDVTVTNTGRRTVKRVALRCQFFNVSDEAVNTGSTFFNDLAAGASETNTMMVLSPGIVRGVCTDTEPANGAIR